MEKTLWVRTGRRLILIDTASLIFIYGNKFGCNLYFNTPAHHHSESLTVSNLLASLETELKNLGFVRCHRNYLINKDHIELFRINKNSLCYKNFSVPISRRNLKKVLLEFNLNTLSNEPGKNILCRKN